MIIDRLTQISDIEEEGIVIGTLLSYPEWTEGVSEDLFTDLDLKNVCKAILSLRDEGKIVDVVFIDAWLTEHRIDHEMADIGLLIPKGVYDEEHFRFHVYRLQDLSARRKLEKIIYKYSTSTTSEAEDIGEVISKMTDELSSILRLSDDGILTANDAVVKLVERMDSNKSKKGVTGTPTGFKTLDRRTGGLQIGQLITVGAESSQGKTSFAINIAMNAALNNEPIAFYSLEMGADELMARIVSALSKVPSSDMLYRQLDSTKEKMVNDVLIQSSKLPIYFDETSTKDLDSIISSIRAMKIKYGIKGAVVDYIQILARNEKGRSEEQIVADVARRFKNLAKELGIWILELSQLSRDKDNPEPNKARLRQSGQIEEASDIVILLYRPEVYNRRFSGEFSGIDPAGSALVDIAKGRGVGLEKFIVGFNPELTLFYDKESKPIMEQIEAPF